MIIIKNVILTEVPMPIDIFIQRLFIAFICGLIIGLERQLRHKMSAVVTNVLVCMGSFLFLSFAMHDSANEQARLASQVISGIGFLGGGVIIRDGFSIRGLNTAATLWCSAALGLLISQGYINYAFLGTAFILGANIFLKPLAIRVEHSKYGNRDTEFNYKIKLQCNDSQEEEVIKSFRSSVENKNITIRGIESRRSDETNHMSIKIYILTFGQNEEDIWKTLNYIHNKYDIYSYSYELEA